MNSLSRLKKEWLKDQIDKMDTSEHSQVYSIIMKYTDQSTKTQNGVLVSTDNMTDECLTNIEKYVTFCLDQRKRMDEDTKTRKIYERMMSD